MKTRITSLLLLCLFCLASAFGQSNIQNDQLTEKDISEEVLKALMVSCYVCHNPRVKSHDDIISPPLVTAKYFYKMRYPEKEEFVAKMADFVLDPTNKKAIMQGAVMQYGVMPDMPLDADQVTKICEFIYDNEIEEPSWFPAHFEEKHGMKWKGQNTP